MTTLRYQTSGLVPAPFAFAIQLDLSTIGQSLDYIFDLEYLDRDQLALEEIQEEGFTGEDNLKLTGSLPTAWKEEYEKLLLRTEASNKTELEEEEEYWEVSTGGKSFYPKNHVKWADFLEQIRQAILENSNIESPLTIEVLQVSGETKTTTSIIGSFKNRGLQIKTGTTVKNLKWQDLERLLSDFYTADFKYELAKDKPGSHEALYLNFGDEYWFELGKSYLNKPSKITSWLHQSPS